MFHRLFPEALITTFECDPQVLPQARKLIASVKNITLIEKAVSDHEGTLSFNVLPDHPGSSSAFVHRKESSVQIDVPMTTLEKELSRAPDVVWMDAQGSELNILKGAGSLLKDISIIHTEVFFTSVYYKQPVYRDIKRFLNDNGFTLLTFTNRGKNFGDAVFINTKVYKRKTPQWFSEFFSYAPEKILGKMRKLLSR